MFNSENMEVIALTVLYLISELIYPEVMNVSGQMLRLIWNVDCLVKGKIGFITSEVCMNVSEDLMNLCMKKKQS